VTTRGDDGHNAREDLPECNVTQTGVGCGASNIRQHWAGGDDVRISGSLSLSQNVAGAGVMDKRNIGRRAHIRHISVRAGAWHRQRHCRAWRRGLTLACCRTGGRERPGHLMCRLSREQRRPLMGRVQHTALGDVLDDGKEVDRVHTAIVQRFGRYDLHVYIQPYTEPIQEIFPGIHGAVTKSSLCTRRDERMFAGPGWAPCRNQRQAEANTDRKCPCVPQEG
jgi:hypothetical protein